MSTPRLKYIEVENFKSFKGRQKIGPLKQFNAIIGPNGSGKSNLMDAISFVVGEKTTSLRVKRLSHLIHGAAVGKPVSRSASVTATFVLDEDEEKEITFQRSVQGASSEYKVNNNVVSSREYLTELENIHINVNAKNFLVFQGAVESVVMKHSKELTLLFEEISGALKEEYDTLKEQMQKVEDEIHVTYREKKASNAGYRQAKLVKQEADQYVRMKSDLNIRLLELQLFKLYHNELETQSLDSDLKEKQKEVEKIEHKIETAEEMLKLKKKEQGKCGRELAKIEQDIREAEVALFKKKPHFIKAKEHAAHTQKKLEDARKTLEKARKANEAHENDIRNLEGELAEAKRAKDAYDAEIAEESQSQGRDVHLEDEQVGEYTRLKKEAARRSAVYVQELDSLSREQSSDQDRLDNFSRTHVEAESKHTQKEHEKEEIEKRVRKLEEYVRATEQALADQRQRWATLQSDVGSVKECAQERQQRLDVILEQLGDAKTDNYEDSRRVKRREVVEHLKSILPGVYDRMINLCHPIQNKYNVAVTKVLGKNMEAIIVDAEHTACQCIQYLRQHRLDRETFLPLDYLSVQPIKEELRRITEPRGVKLVYDILQFEPPAIASAVMFVTHNAVVCQTAEDAMKVAYELGGSRNDAVALDGTYYHKSGIISGGNVDLAHRAKRWDEKHVAQLKAERDILTKELRNVFKESRKESELNTSESLIKGLEARLKYSKNDLESSTNQVQAVETELTRLSAEIATCRQQIIDIEKIMRGRKRQMKEAKVKMDKVEDKIFSQFCQQIGVSNIRQYEDRDLLSREEHKQKRLEFQNRIDKISNSLDFERSRDTQGNIDRWERTIKDEEEKLKICKKQEQRLKDDMDEDLQQIDKLKAELVAKKHECDRMEKEVAKRRREVSSIAKDVDAIQKQVILLESKIESKKNERHAILMQCKLDDISIPMSVGSMHDIVRPDPSQSSSTDASGTQQDHEREARIEIDYSTLSRSLRNLKQQNEVDKAAGELLQSVMTLQDTLNEIVAPDMKALEKFELARRESESTNEKFQSLCAQSSNVKAAFERVKQQRYERFTKCFDHVSNEIDDIYKTMTGRQSAQAFLSPENFEEPYLEGVMYNCIVPGKSFRSMSNLSGGEKTVAALALLFAIHSYRPAPFFVLDEIDAALDNTNVGKVIKYIQHKSESLQMLVISLKEEFYSHADNLIGVWPQYPVECLESQVLTCELTNYPVSQD